MALFFILFLFVAGSCGEISSEKKTIKRYVPLDKIGGGVVLREVKEETTYRDNPNMLKLINLNDFDNDALRYVKRNFDEIDRAGFRSMGKRNFIEIDKSDFRRMGQRDLDEIYGSGFLNMKKRNFDEIDRTGFRSMKKRNSDKIVRTGVQKMEKREFDETDRIRFSSAEEGNFDSNDKRFQSIMKKNFDEIDRAGFGNIGKRNLNKIGKTQLQNKSDGNSLQNGELSEYGVQMEGKKTFLGIDSLRSQNKDLRHFHGVDGKNLSNKNYSILRQNFDVINKFRNMKKRSYNQKEKYDYNFINR